MFAKNAKYAKVAIKAKKARAKIGWNRKNRMKSKNSIETKNVKDAKRPEIAKNAKIGQNSRNPNSGRR